MIKRKFKSITALAIALSIIFSTVTTSLASSIDLQDTQESQDLQDVQVSQDIEKVSASIDSIVLGINPKGYNPTKGNSLLIEANISIPSDQYINTNLRLRILDSKGNYVFQKVFKNASTSVFSYKWNGKTGKKNAAGLKSGKYVGQGKYKVELYLYGATDVYEQILIPTTKTKSFKVNKNAPTEMRLPLFTGNKYTDYMAEQMIKSAGIKSSMSDDEKVKRIYHYMTYNFKHIHSDKFYSQPNKYNYKKLKSKINSYKKKSDKNFSKGKLLYTYENSDYYTEIHMQKRCGECNAHAAAFKILCNHVGIEAGICNGYYLNRNGTKAGHYWNYAVVDGKKYYYDVDVEIQNKGKGQGDYYWYKKTLSESKKTHEYK